MNGQFTFSLKGVRRALRRSGTTGGTRARDVVDVAESSMTSWLGEGGKRASDFHTRTAGSEGRILDSTPYIAPSEDGQAAEPVPAIRELSRLPHAMLWVIADPYDRFIIHCVARYYGVVSFSAPDTTRVDGARITHILRPNMVRPSVSGAGETPPGTDLSATEGETSAAETEGSEMGSESEWEELGTSDRGVGVDFEESSNGSYDIFDYESDDGDVGSDEDEDDAASELETSLVDLRLAPTVPAHSSIPVAIPIPSSSSSVRPAFFPSPSSTPRPLAAALSGSTPTPTRARRTRTSFPPASSRSWEEGSLESRSRSSSSVAVNRPTAVSHEPPRSDRKGWQWPETTFAAYLFS